MAIQKISNAVINTGAVTSDSIATGAVNAADILDGTITTAKLNLSGNLIIGDLGNTSDNVSVRITGGSAGYSNVQFSDPDDVNVGMIQYNHASNYMQFTTNDSEQMRIDSNGNVGIGTTSPATVLELAAATNTNKITFDPTNGGNNGDVLGGFEAQNDGAVGQIAVRRESSTTSGYITFESRSTGGALTERMRISGSGNVGIKTASPDVLLDVGDSDHGSAGNVGIQIQSSQDFSTVYSGSNSNTWPGVQIVNHDDTSNRTAAGITFVHRSSSSGLAAIQSTSDAADRADIRFITRGTGNTIAERVIIDYDGNLGVGTSTPGSFDDASSVIKVDVYDGFLRNRITSNNVAPDASTRVFYWDCSGNGAVIINGVIRGLNSVRTAAATLDVKATWSDGNLTIRENQVYTTNMTVSVQSNSNRLEIWANKPGGGTSMSIDLIGFVSTVNTTFSKG